MTTTRASGPSAEPPGAAVGHWDAERLRHLCLAILNALDSGGGAGALAPALPAELARAIGVGVADVATGLRSEADALAAAVAELRSLPSRYLAVPPAATALLNELEAAHDQATRFADALDAFRLGSGARSSAPPLPGSSPPLAPPVGEGERPTVLTRAARSAAGGTSGEELVPGGVSCSAADVTTRPHATVPTGEATSQLSASQRASQVFMAGEEHRKRREFDRAEGRYTEAIEIDPRFGPAYSRRGQIRLAQKNIALAVADFNATLALDDTAAEAWLWRGDAHALSGRFDEAISDYARAIALRPDLERARFNRAVAERRKEEAAAPAEPTGEPVSAPVPQPGPAHGPAPAPPAPVSGATGKGDGQLVVTCPHCGQVGEISWNRLGKVFACKACGRRFGIGAEGKAVELTEAPGGKWVEARKAREQTRRRRSRRRVVVGLIALVLFPALGFAGWQAVRPPEDPPGEVELPQDLGARAEMFGRGWVANDVRLMKRLTSPTQDKAVYSWYTRHRPPLALRGTTRDPPDGTRIDVTVQPGKTGWATTRVRVSNPTAAPAEPPVELVLLWEERADGWYFIPPTK